MYSCSRTGLLGLLLFMYIQGDTSDPFCVEKDVHNYRPILSYLHWKCVSYNQGYMQSFINHQGSSREILVACFNGTHLMTGIVITWVSQKIERYATYNV
jgi:hypothetical protein